MAVSKLTCPECNSVLRPAKPLPPGKSVKCPKCGVSFTANEDAPEPALYKPKKDDGAEEAPRKPKKSADGKASPKKSPGKTAAVPKPAAKDEDESEEGGTYRFVDAGKTAEEEEDKPDINYAPDMSVKDLRGPAQLAVNAPTNALIAVGALGFFGWVALLILILIPTVFPIESDVGDKSATKSVVGLEPGLGNVRNGTEPTPEPTRQDPNRKTMFNFLGFNVAAIGVLAWYLFILSLAPIFLGMLYSGLVAYGGVKIQNLEGYRWGMASAVMAMLPLNSFGFMASTSMLLGFFIGMFADDTAGVLIAFMALEAVAGLGVGAWMVVTLLSDRVLKGFAYKAE